MPHPNDINIAAKPSLAIKGSVKLDATGNIELRNGLLATTDLSQPSAYQNITLYSSGGYVAQFNESRTSFKDDLSFEPLQGNQLVVRAQTGWAWADPALAGLVGLNRC